MWTLAPPKCFQFRLEERILNGMLDMLPLYDAVLFLPSPPHAISVMQDLPEVGGSPSSGGMLSNVTEHVKQLWDRMVTR